MVRKCVYCQEKQRTNSGISYFPFPDNTALKNLWMKSIPTDLKLTKSSVLCSKHFATECMSTQFGRRGMLLKIDAVPTQFSTNLNCSIALHKPSTSHQSTFNKEDETCTKKSGENVYSEEKHNQRSSTVSANSENLGLIENSDNKPILSSSTFSVTSLSATLTAPSVAENKTSRMKDNAPIHLKKRRRLCYMGDIHTSDFSSPEKAKRIWELMKEQNAAKQRKMKSLCQQNRRLKSRIRTMKDLITDLTDKQIISENAASTLMDTVPSPASHLLERIMQDASKKKYSPELRNFAITLNLYSKKAYEYVRKTFFNCLPHHSTITKWYRSVDGSPGFTDGILKVNAEEASKNNETIQCKLVMDEMSIVEWNSTQFMEFVDVGTDFDSDVFLCLIDSL